MIYKSVSEILNEVIDIFQTHFFHLLSNYSSVGFHAKSLLKLDNRGSHTVLSNVLFQQGRQCWCTHCKEYSVKWLDKMYRQ